MKRYLLDTGIASDYVHRRFDTYQIARAVVRTGAVVGICVPVLGELWSGVELSASRDRNAAELRRGLADLTIWPYTDVAAQEFGRLFAQLRRKGRPMQQIDIQIAAVVQTLPNCTLVSKNSDFRAVDGLSVVDWTQSPTS